MEFIYPWVLYKCLGVPLCFYCNNILRSSFGSESIIYMVALKRCGCDASISFWISARFTPYHCGYLMIQLCMFVCACMGVTPPPPPNKQTNTHTQESQG